MKILKRSQQKIALVLAILKARVRAMGNAFQDPKPDPKFPWKWKTAIGIGTIFLSAIVTAIAFWIARPKAPKFPDRNCQIFVEDPLEAKIPPGAEEKILGLEGASREAVRQLWGFPLCTLPRLSLRAGAILERELYQTADGDRIVVAYEDDRYIGFARIDMGNRLSPSLPKIKEIELKQNWEVRVGTKVNNRAIVGGLGDISVRVRGEVFAPTDGTIESDFLFVSDGSIFKNPPDCILFSSPQTPAYLLRLCGLYQYRRGSVSQGNAIGRTDGHLHVALLSFRKDSEDASQWVYVSPSTELIERLVR